MSFPQAQRLDLRVAIIIAEARAGACAVALAELASRGKAINEAHQALRREQDILAALRIHAETLKEAARSARGF